MRSSTQKEDTLNVNTSIKNSADYFLSNVVLVRSLCDKVVEKQRIERLKKF